MTSEPADAPGALNRRIRFAEAPGPDFDARRASDEELARYGLPRRPDSERQPLRYDFWQRTFGKRLRFVAAHGLRPPVARHRTSYILAARVPVRRHQTSLNWSGGYITPRDGTVFSEIYGAWQVPAIQPGRPTGQHFGMSTWIGLDGQRRYHHATLPQFGTGHYIGLDAGGQPKPPAYLAWVQWWDRDGIPDPPLELPVAVHPGNSIRCWMAVLPNATSVACLFVNDTIGAAVAWTMSAPSNPIPYRVSGATAEWVTERPSIHPTSTPFAFARYDTVVFRECLAVARGPGGVEQERRLAGARLIDMRETRPAPSRTAIISDGRLPSRLLPALQLLPARELQTVYR